MFSKTSSRCPEDDIVISGISGRFPNARNMHEFEHKLYNKVWYSMRNTREQSNNELYID